MALLLFVLLIIWIVWYFYNWRSEEFLQSKESIVQLNLGSNKQPLYLRAKIWGIAGNHEQIVLSRSNNSAPDTTIDYIFYTSEVFYRVENDSILILYVTESSIVEPANKTPNVIIIGLETVDQIGDYTTNYKKYGLERISVYE